MNNLNSHKEQINTEASNSDLSEKDNNKLNDEYLESFSNFGFIFPFYTLFKCKKFGTLIGIIIYKIAFYITISIYFMLNIYNLGTTEIIITLLGGISFLNIPNLYVGDNAKKMIYSTGKYKSINEMYEHEKRKEKISTFLAIISQFIKILILGAISLGLAIIVVGLGWEN